jgi:hypothetical protein
MPVLFDSGVRSGSDVAKANSIVDDGLAIGPRTTLREINLSHTPRPNQANDSVPGKSLTAG